MFSNLVHSKIILGKLILTLTEDIEFKVSGQVERVGRRILCSLARNHSLLFATHPMICSHVYMSAVPKHDGNEIRLRSKTKELPVYFEYLLFLECLIKNITVCNKLNKCIKRVKKNFC
jgi:hypothetical protein